MLRVRGIGASLLTLALIATGAGCGSDDEGLPPLPSLTAISPAVSTSPTSPVQPSATPSAAMTEGQAIEAAVRFYYEGYGRAYDTGDADELARGSTKDCDCPRAVETVRRALARGTVEGARIKVVRIGEPRVFENTAAVGALVDSADGRLRLSDGSTEMVSGQGEVSKLVQLINVEGTWLVGRITEPG